MLCSCFYMRLSETALTNIREKRIMVRVGKEDDGNLKSLVQKKDRSHYLFSKPGAYCFDHPADALNRCWLCWLGMADSIMVASVGVSSSVWCFPGRQ